MENRGTKVRRRSSLGVRASTFWMGGSRLLSQAVQFVASIVLARLLSPSEFGLLAIASAFTVFATIFTELGLNAAVVQRAELDEDYLSTAFWLNFCSGVVLGIIMGLVALPIALLYGHRSLWLIVALSGLQLPLSFGVVQLSLLERAMQFRRVAMWEFALTLVNFTVVICLVIAGCGAVSVVFGSLVAVTGLSIIWICESRWLPKSRPTRAALREISRYGGEIAKFNSVNYWARNVDNLLLGKVAGAAALGFYSRAYSLMLVPVQMVTVVVGRVLLPQLSRVQDDLPAMRASYKRALRLTSLTLFPVSGFVLGAAPNLAVTLYGSEWRPAGHVLTILMISVPLQIVAGTCGAIYQATGETRALFRRGSLNALILVVGIGVGGLWRTPVSVAWGYTASMCVVFPFAVLQPWGYIMLTFRSGIAVVVRAITASVVGGCCMALAQSSGTVSEVGLWGLTSGFCVFMGFYLVALMGMAGWGRLMGARVQVGR